MNVDFSTYQGLDLKNGSEVTIQVQYNGVSVFLQLLFAFLESHCKRCEREREREESQSCRRLI